MKPEERSRDYAPLAWFCDRYWGEGYHPWSFPSSNGCFSAGFLRQPRLSSTPAVALDVSHLGMPGDLGLGRIFFRAEI